VSDAIELDFTDVKDFAPIAKEVPKGNYLLKVDKIELSKSKAGNPMWVVDSVFVNAGPHQGQTIREYLALTEKALFKVKSWLDAVHGKTLPKKKIKLPNTTASLLKQFGGKVYGAHIDDGDPYTNDEGVTSTRSEVKYHLFPALVDEASNQTPAAEVVASTPAPEEEPPANAPDSAPEVATDVATTMEEFDLDSL